MSRAAQKLISASGGEDAYEIEQSIMLNHDDSTYLWYEPGAGGSRTTWTFSGWFKPGLQADGYLGVFGHQAGSGASWYQNDLSFNNAANMNLDWQGNRSGSSRLITNRKFRDQSAWYHIVFAVDTTQGTASNRMKLYINGVQETSFSTETYPSSSESLYILKNGDRVNIGRIQEAYFGDAYVAEVHVVDGSQLAPTSFGEVNSTTLQWVPIEYEGSHGTQGSYLKFASGAIGTDSSGNGNNWTAVNLANSDVMLDTPTNNFCTYNSLDNGSTALSQGNLKFVNSSGNSDTGCTMQIPFTGKWYWEIRATAVDAMYYGITRTSYTGTDGSYGSDGRAILYNGTFWNGSSAATYGSSYSDGDIVNVAFDCDNSKLYFGKNGTWFNSGDPAAGSNPAGTVTASDGWVPNMYGNSGTQNDLNFGQNGTFNGTVTAQGNADGNGYGNFYYSPPTGFLALCTKNLPEPAVKKSTEYFNPIIYTGSDDDSVSQSVTGVGFQPDLVWIKKRSGAAHSVLTDAVRGVTKALNSSQDAAEVDDTYGVTAFGTDGFTVREQASAGGQVNTGTLVSWNWKANGSGSSNTDGSINTTATSANTTSGFSIGTYTGEGGVKLLGMV